MTQQVKYEGTLFTLGGREYIVPGLSTKLMRKHRDDIIRAVQLEKGATPDASPEEQQRVLADMLDIAVKLTASALSRNYSDLDLEQVEDWVDMNNVRPLIAAVMGQSGMKLVRQAPAVAESGEP